MKTQAPRSQTNSADEMKQFTAWLAKSSKRLWLLLPDRGDLPPWVGKVKEALIQALIPTVVGSRKKTSPWFIQGAGAGHRYAFEAAVRDAMPVGAGKVWEEEVANRRRWLARRWPQMVAEPLASVTSLADEADFIRGFSHALDRGTLVDGALAGENPRLELMIELADNYKK